MNELISITSSPDYLHTGIVIIKEVLIQPFDGKNCGFAKLFIEISNAVQEIPDVQTWEIYCHDLLYNTSNKIHEPIIRPSIKILTQHPALWNYSSETYFSITGGCKNISELIGDLYIEHDKMCGNWVDFHSTYSSLPTTLITMKDNQFAVPNSLVQSCFDVLKKHGVSFFVNEIEEREDDLKMLLFSDPFKNDNYSFGQPYLIAKDFSARKI